MTTTHSPEGVRADFLSRLRRANQERQDAWKHGGRDASPELMTLFRGTELSGEVGEALNVVKKLVREAMGWRGSRATVAQLAEELADVVICTDLLAAEYQIDLTAATIAKFNATSEEVGLPHRLDPLPVGAAGEPIDMVLHCPKCGKQHIDEPEAINWRDPSRDAAGTVGARWTNPPHRSHLCHGCGHIWRPADVPTNGVPAIKTKGKADSSTPARALPLVGGDRREAVARIIWERFAPSHNIEWADESNRAEYLLTADAILALPADEGAVERAAKLHHNWFWENGYALHSWVGVGPNNKQTRLAAMRAALSAASLPRGE